MKSGSSDHMGTSLRIGVDLDECVYPFVDAYRRVLSAQGIDPAHLGSPTNRDLWTCWPITSAQFQDTYYQAAESGHIFLSEAPIAGAESALRRLAQRGYHITIVTARDLPGIEGACRIYTERWLKLHHITYDELVLTADKGSLGLPILIDDTTKHLQQVEDSGGLGYLFKASHNAGQEWPRQIQNWNQVPNCLETPSE